MSIGNGLSKDRNPRAAAGPDGLLRQSSDPYIMVREVPSSVMTLSPMKTCRRKPERAGDSGRTQRDRL